MMKRWVRKLRDPFVLGGLAAFLVSQISYLLTLTLSCPFWDSGEFIATSYVLGIPHPPGTPLYVLIGRLFSLLPIGQIATRINFISALASSLTVLFTYIVIVDLARRMRRGAETWLDTWITVGGALTGALFLAFSRTFWDNAIEAEVYALSSLVMILTVWLVLKWEGSRDEAGHRDNNLLLLIVYLLFVAVGIHMGTLLVAPAIFLFVLLVAAQTVLHRDVLLTLLGAAGAAVFFMLLEKLQMPEGLALALAALGFAALIVWKWSRLGRRNLAFWALALAIAGLTVQLFMIVRAQHNPPINEADPNNWHAFWLVLSRDQYKPPNPFVTRQATWAIQFTRHFWDYWRDQYDLGVRPAWFGMLLPFMIGTVGAGVQALRDRRRFLLVLALMFFTTLFLVFYLNFKEEEVRDRDYFFVAGFHFFTLWIGLGAITIARWLRGGPALVEGVRRETSGSIVFGLGTTAILLALAFFPPFVHRPGEPSRWYLHDRTGFLVARDYAYNMLEPLEPNAIIFTNGDNDTFPLWYLQEVEKIRKDIRVVNLSLLNTQWYIRQIRDEVPRVRVSLTEDQIDELRGVLMPDGRVILIKDVMVRQILEDNPDRPIYLAVTVPDEMELEKRLVMEGLVFRIASEDGEPERIDLPKTWTNLNQVYKYGGLLDAQGRYDTRVHKDENASRLIQNYVSAYVRVAHEALRQKDEALALQALERARTINPDFPGVSYTMGYLWLQSKEYAKAEAAFRELIQGGDHSTEAYRLLGASLAGQGKQADTELAYREMVRYNPEDFDAYRVLFTHLWETNKKEEAVGLIREWLQRHPDDTATRQALEELNRSSRSDSAPAPSAGAQGR
jgi:Flp pilus assembly protein TadD